MRRATTILIALLLLAVAGCEWRGIEPGGPAPLRYRDQIAPSFTKVSDVTYGRATKQDGTTIDLKLDVYRAAGDTIFRRPAIVWVHGGSFRSGSKASPEIVAQAAWFAQRGYVSLAIDYRLSPTGCTQVNLACITSITQAKEDAQAAVRFARAKASTYGIDVNRVAIAGTSAGAITALNVGFGPDQVGTSGNPGFSSRVKAAVSLSGAAITTKADPNETPALLFHGTADGLVPYEWALRTVEGADTAGVRAELTTWEGDGHVPWGKHSNEILVQTRNFLYQALQLSTAPR